MKKERINKKDSLNLGRGYVAELVKLVHYRKMVNL